MRIKLLLPLLAASSFSASVAAAQVPDSAARAAMAAATAADHRRMMELLGIYSIRPGPSGNPQAPNAANADEARVPPYTLPDALVTKSGARVATAEQWWRSRR